MKGVASTAESHDTTIVSKISFMKTLQRLSATIYITNLNIPHSAHAGYLCVSYDSQNKRRLFNQTALTGWPLEWRYGFL
jgi:hypothetical protein